MNVPAKDALERAMRDDEHGLKLLFRHIELEVKLRNHGIPEDYFFFSSPESLLHDCIEEKLGLQVEWNTFIMNGRYFMIDISIVLFMTIIFLFLLDSMS